MTSYIEADRAVRGRSANISVGSTCMSYPATKWINGRAYDTTMVTGMNLSLRNSTVFFLNLL